MTASLASAGALIRARQCAYPIRSSEPSLHPRVARRRYRVALRIFTELVAGSPSMTARKCGERCLEALARPPALLPV